jgi:SAM-dependent methyltransferase
MMLRLGKQARWPFAPGVDADEHLAETFRILRTKWGEVPGGEQTRVRSEHLLKLSDQELLRLWSAAFADSAAGDAYSVRGWYHTLYSDVFRGKKVLEVGSGLGFDGITFAANGADWTFVDIVQTNLEVVRRLCKLKGLTNVRFCYMEDLRSLDPLPDNYAAIYGQGSLINLPLEATRVEAQALLKHLSVGGRWIELAYPRRRWIHDGRMPADKWGQKTDGGAPWVEWHDLKKIRDFLAPALFDVVFTLDFHKYDFNWFDLIRRR